MNWKGGTIIDQVALRAKWDLLAEEDLLFFHGLWGYTRDTVIARLCDPNEDPSTWSDSDKRVLDRILKEELAE